MYCCKDNVRFRVFLLSITWICCVACIASSDQTCYDHVYIVCRAFTSLSLSLSSLSQGKTLDLVQFSQNEAAFSVAVCTFASRSDTEWYVIVGTASHMTLSPRACSGGALVLFKLSPDGAKLEHVHTVSRCMCVLMWRDIVSHEVV